MPGPAFLSEILEATAAVDEVMAEAWMLLPKKAAPEATAAPVPDSSRAAVTFLGTFSDAQAKPELANSYDRRQVRRPGEESGHPVLRISPAALAAQTFDVRQGDLLQRQADGITWKAASVFKMAGGTLRVTINILG